jgi:hypothetical protein
MVLANHGQTPAQPQPLGFVGNDETFSDLLLDSSGGSLRRFFSDASGSRGELRELPGLRVGGESDNGGVESPLVQQLHTIADTFTLNRRQLADACIVTRAALYGWLAGTEPRREALQRIAALHRAALDWRRAGFPRPAAALQLPLLKQRSLLDLLCATPLDLDTIHFLGMRLALQEAEATTGELDDPFR